MLIRCVDQNIRLFKDDIAMKQLELDHIVYHYSIICQEDNILRIVFNLVIFYLLFKFIKNQRWFVLTQYLPRQLEFAVSRIEAQQRLLALLVRVRIVLLVGECFVTNGVPHLTVKCIHK